MNYKFIKITEFEQRVKIKKEIGASEYSKLFGPFGVLYTDKFVIYILNQGSPHFPVYLLVDYNGHRYGLLGANKRQPVSPVWEIHLVDTAIDDADKIKEMIRLVCNSASYIDLYNDTLTIISKDYEKLIIQNIKENAYGIKLF
ncbi:hypothetical protein [Ruminococcus sp.]|uniref:hypothetical protein n=1 Tax=Ruminococcus sp. TaxID=41978 RepID=UPI0025CD79D6|nr:hypothetical protein [Ruminococcus sp.]